MTAAQTVFSDRLADDVAVAANAVLVRIGDRLGLYRILAEAGPLDSIELARHSGTSERYVREWLAAQAAAGYVDLDAEMGTYRLPPERAAELAADVGSQGLLGAIEAVAAMWRDESKLVRAFRTGDGIAWDEHHPSLFRGIERMLGASWSKHLLHDWIPAAPGVARALEEGCDVADVGCGSGAALRILADAYPTSRFVGFDAHLPSVERARFLAKEAGLDERVHFEVATARELPGSGYALITSFHCLLDLGDPAGAARRVHRALAPGGHFLVVEPATAPEHSPSNRFFHAYSTCVSVPASRSQEVGACVGSQADAKRLLGVLRAARFGCIDVLQVPGAHRVVLARP